MRKISLIGFVMLIVSIPTFAGGLLTNTNQHAAFLRMLSRGATFEIDGALSNPAGLAFLPNDGFHMGLSVQSAFQTRNIDASFYTYNGIAMNNGSPVMVDGKPVPTKSDNPFNKYYKGKAAAPVIPSVFAAYKKGDWTISGFFAITGGGGKASVCYTTLVHGKVQFSAPNVGTVTLQPGEQAVVSANGTEKRTVDLDEYIGWVNGVYNFKNRSLGEIMETFERWYDIQVYYETPDLRDITYSGSLKRYGAVNSFLDALELTGDLTYKISGRKVLIYDGMKE